jgi:hypothetical protein
VVVVVKAWEPPLMEHMDFLAAVRARLGAAVPIVVAAVGDADLGAWRHRLVAHGDPWVCVKALP